MQNVVAELFLAEHKCSFTTNGQLYTSWEHRGYKIKLSNVNKGDIDSRFFIFLNTIVSTVVQRIFSI